MAIIDFAGTSDNGTMAGVDFMGIITHVECCEETVLSEAGVLRASERSLLP